MKATNQNPTSPGGVPPTEGYLMSAADDFRAAMRKVSMVAYAKTTATRTVDAFKVLEGVRAGKWHVPVEKVRRLFNKVLAKSGDFETAKKAVKPLKERLPAVLFSGTFSRRRADAVLTHSGLVTADLDELGDRLPEIRAKLLADPHLFALFASPTASGLKAVFAVESPDPSTNGETSEVFAARAIEFHERAFAVVESRVKELVGVEIDPSGKDISRLCFVSSDPAMHLKADAEPLSVPAVAPKPVETEATAAKRAGASVLGDDLSRAEDALRFVPSEEYQVWLEVGMALKESFGDAGLSAWRNWSARSSKYEEGCCEKKWPTFDRPAGAAKTVASIFHLAQQAGWKPPEPARKPEVPDVEATLQRLAKLSRLEYDNIRETEAKKLNVRTSTLDTEVSERRPKVEVKASLDVDPWPEPVEGAALLVDLKASFNRFVVLPAKGDILASIWTLHTYVFDAFPFTPYLHVVSPERECGKSTLAELLASLCNRATTPGGMSAAAMFRRIEARCPTLLLDEWDTLSDENRQAALNVLNTGFKFNGTYTICVGDEHEDRDFRTFCPKAIFGLSATKLPDTTRSRCILLGLQKKKPSEKIDKLRKFDGLELRRKCARWAKDNRERLSTEPLMPGNFSARQEDISEPLVSIADLCGGGWPELIRDALCKFFKALDAEEASVSVELLKDIRDAFGAGDRIGSKAMEEHLNGLECRPWPSCNDGHGITQRQIAARLKAFDLHSTDIWTGSKSVKGYVKGHFSEAFERYLPPSELSKRETARMPVFTEENALLPSASGPLSREGENATNANAGAASRALADGKPEPCETALVL